MHRKYIKKQHLTVNMQELVLIFQPYNGEGEVAAYSPESATFG